MKKTKRTPTERTQSAIAKLRVRYTFREIVDLLREDGLITSISHLSRIMDGQRESSDALADAAERVAR